jgi:hypothetical protein
MLLQAHELDIARPFGSKRCDEGKKEFSEGKMEKTIFRNFEEPE